MKRIAPLVAFLALLVVGCGPKEMPKEEVKQKSELLELANKAFTEQKDWSKLSDAEKKPFLDHYKEEEAAAEAFRNMQNGIRYFAGSTPGAPVKN